MSSLQLPVNPIVMAQSEYMTDLETKLNMPIAAWLEDFHYLLSGIVPSMIRWTLAGGAIQRSLEGQIKPPPDWDIYFPCRADRDAFITGLKTQGKVKIYGRGRNNSYFNCHVLDVTWWPDINTTPGFLQLIVPNSWDGTAKNLFEGFDLTPCMVSIDQSGMFDYALDSLKHIDYRQFEVYQVHHNSTDERKVKLISRGYTEILAGQIQQSKDDDDVIDAIFEEREPEASQAPVCVCPVSGPTSVLAMGCPSARGNECRSR